MTRQFYIKSITAPSVLFGAFLLRLLCCVYFFLLISVFLTIPNSFRIVEMEEEKLWPVVPCIFSLEDERRPADFSSFFLCIPSFDSIPDFHSSAWQGLFHLVQWIYQKDSLIRRPLWAIGAPRLYANHCFPFFYLLYHFQKKALLFLRLRPELDPVARKKNSAFLLRLLCCVYFFLLISVFLTIPNSFRIVEIEEEKLWPAAPCVFFTEDERRPADFSSFFLCISSFDSIPDFHFWAFLNLFPFSWRFPVIFI